MVERVRQTWDRLTGSLWFVPVVLVVAAGALAVGLVELSPYVDDEALVRFPRLFGAGADSSRSMLATIAGSVITVAGVTFSITVVAVSQASSQYTPRILRNFMRDRPSQLVLGALVGTFVYCLIVIRTIRGEAEGDFIPSLAVLVAFLLAIVGIGFLVYFIHHISGTLEAGSILARVRAETVAAVDRLFPDQLGDEPPGRGSEQVPVEALEHEIWFPVRSASTGYIQRVDPDGLLRLAADCRTVIRMERGIGEFVIEGTPLAAVAGGAPDARLSASLNALYTLDSYRTVRQDAAFGVRQIVDIALKALSPGVNDSTTAVTCVDQLGAILVRLASRRVEDPYRVRDGELRVIARGPTFASLLATALSEIRRNATSNVSVLTRMLRVLVEVGAATTAPERRERVRAEAELIVKTARRHVEMPEDRAEVEDAYAQVLRAAGG